MKENTHVQKEPPSRQAHVFCSLTITDVRFVLVFNADKFCSPATGSSVLKDNADPLLTPQGRDLQSAQYLLDYNIPVLCCCF